MLAELYKLFLFILLIPITPIVAFIGYLVRKSRAVKKKVIDVKNRTSSAVLHSQANHYPKKKSDM